MSLGSWSPSSAQQAQNLQLSDELLQQFLQLHHNNHYLDLSRHLNAQQQEQLAPVMSLDAECWEAATTSLNDDDVIALMQFFTLAENLPGWEAGEQSPVIWLGKVLKKRGTGINKELTLWIKKHSDNRFLPHGSLL